jgi:hypothetical protein
MQSNEKIPDFNTWRNPDANSLPTVSDDQMLKEQKKREFEKPFPLHVFNDKIKPFLDALHREYNLPRSFIGLSLLSAYSTAVGSAYHIKQNKLGDIYFPIWACLEGVTSSGKSLVMKQVFKPLYNIQKEFEDEWRDQTKGLTDDAISRLKSKDLIYSEAHIPTLIKDIMPNNPKGVLQDADEILAWINGMNQLSKGGKEGTDEQFWLKSWNCSPHRKRLSGNKIFVIEKPFLNVFGGIQPTITHKLFRNDRDTTGFIYRILFALPEGKSKIAEPNALFDMPEEWEEIHNKCIRSLYYGLPMWEGIESREMNVKPSAVKIYDQFFKQKIYKANNATDDYERSILSGIVGKMKEYAMRLAGLLHLADKALDHKKFENFELIDNETMERALILIDYFHDSAWSISERVNNKIIAPYEVIQMANWIKNRYTFQMIGDELFSKEVKNAETRRIKASRLMKRYLQEYPKAFGADM